MSVTTQSVSTDSAPKKRNLTIIESAYVAVMLFGMFFGAGNLIFPVFLGANAGTNSAPAALGFIVTGVGLPLLGVTALAMSRANGLFELSSKASKKYGMFFTCVLYLTIGPFFAIPRCATTSYTVGLERVVPQDGNGQLYLFLFSVVFFALAFFFAMKPSGILTWVGKVLTPIFLVFLAILVFTALFSPVSGASADAAPMGNYVNKSFFTGFLDGYNTMDALASLAFGIVVVSTIRQFGVKDPKDVAVNTARSGFFSCLLMAVIYVAIVVVGVRSRALFPPAENGGVTLAQVARYHLGNVGLFVLAATVTLACLKTAVGLIVSCSETFSKLFPKGPSYRVWAVLITLVSFGLANFGLSAIIEYAVPVLMFLYPLSIVLILLALCGRLFGNSKVVYAWTLGFTGVAAVFDFLNSSPTALRNALHMNDMLIVAQNWLPFSEFGMAWVCPAVVGFVVGYVRMVLCDNKGMEEVARAASGPDLEGSVASDDDYSSSNAEFNEPADFAASAKSAADEPNFSEQS